MLRALAPAISDLGVIVLVLAAFGKLREATSRGSAAGAVELVVATVAAVALGRWPLGLLAVAYGVLTVVAVRQARRGEDCGCFGRTSTVVGPRHVAVNATVAVAAAVAAWQDAGPLVDRLGPGVAGAVAHVALLAAGGASIVATLTAAEDVRAAQRSLRRGPRRGNRIEAAR